MHHRILITLLAAGMLSACGQKGPLYLPEDRPPVGTAGTAAGPTPAASSGESSAESSAAPGTHGRSGRQP